MSSSKSAQDERRQQLLEAAAAVFIRLGYDKTTMSDIAAEARVSRGTVYLYFDGKDAVFEALALQEVRLYQQAWLDHIEADPRGGTVGGVYRAFLYAINSRPLMAAMMRRDRHILGGYLRKPGNLFTAMQSSTMGVDLLKALQDAGAVRKDVDTRIMSHVMDLLAYGLLTIGDFRPLDDLPPYDEVIEAIADMMDRLLTPEDGGNSEAGKAVIRRLVAQFEQPGRHVEAES